MTTITYETYSTRTKGASKVSLMRAENGYDREQDRRLFIYGVKVAVAGQPAYIIGGLSHDEASQRWADEYDALPVPTDREYRDAFTWGRVVAIHRVGDYEIIEFVPNRASNVSPEEYAERLRRNPTHFHPYIRGVDTNRSYGTLERALVGVIAHRFDSAGVNSRAEDYIARMIGLPDGLP